MPGGGEARPPLARRAIADWGRNQNPLARVSVFCDHRELLGLGGVGPGTPGCGHPRCPCYGAESPSPPSPQIDQLRAELLQERSSRQDLECDKVSLERQVSGGAASSPRPCQTQGPSCSRLSFPAPLQHIPCVCKGLSHFSSQMPAPRLDAASSPSSLCPGLRQSILGSCLLVLLLPGMLRGSAAEWGPPRAPVGSPPSLAPWGHSERLPASLPGL